MSGWGPSVHDSQPYQGPAEREGGEREGEGGESLIPKPHLSQRKQSDESSRPLIAYIILLR